MKGFKSTILLALLLLFLTACGGGSTNSTITPPTSSSDILLYSSNPNGYNELSRLENGVEQVLLSNPAFDYWWAKVASDKSSFLVYRSPANPAKNHDDYNNADLIPWGFIPRPLGRNVFSIRCTLVILWLCLDAVNTPLLRYEKVER